VSGAPWQDEGWKGRGEEWRPSNRAVTQPVIEGRQGGLGHIAGPILYGGGGKERRNGCGVFGAQGGVGAAVEEEYLTGQNPVRAGIVGVVVPGVVSDGRGGVGGGG